MLQTLKTDYLTAGKIARHTSLPWMEPENNRVLVDREKQIETVKCSFSSAVSLRKVAHIQLLSITTEYEF